MTGSATSRRIRQDKATAGIKLGATPVEVRPDGYRVYEGIARWGNVLAPYPDLDPPRVEFCPIEEVASPRALASAVGIPFTGGPRRVDWDGGVTLPADHAADLITPETAGNATEGAVLAMWRDDTTSPPCVRVRAIAHTKALIDLIENGAIELSLGYRCDEDRTPGYFDGKPYDLVQRGHEYNHLNVVERARSRAPDGRPARLDSSDGLDVLAAKSILDAAVVRRIRSGTLVPGPGPIVMSSPLLPSVAITIPRAKPSYPLNASSTTMRKTKTDKTTAADSTATRTDAAPEMSAEDAALLAQMSPEAQAALGVAVDDAALAEMAAEGDAPAVETAVAAAAEDDAAEMAGGETSGAAPLAAVLAAIEELKARVAAIEGKTDAACAPKMDMTAVPAAPMTDAAKPNLPADKKAPAAMKTDSLLTDPAAIIAATQAAAVKSYNDAAAFVGVVRKDGHSVNTTDEAAGVMLGVIKVHLPALVPMAEECIKSGRTDSLSTLYGQAESIRRDSLINSQADALAEAFTAPAIPGDGIFRAPASMKTN
jgi:hypothetical protein